MNPKILYDASDTINPWVLAEYDSRLGIWRTTLTRFHFRKTARQYRSQIVVGAKIQFDEYKRQNKSFCTTRNA